MCRCPSLVCQKGSQRHAGSANPVQHGRTMATRTCLLGVFLTLWVPALGYGLLSEPDLPLSPEASLGPDISAHTDLSAKPNISNVQVPIEFEKYPGDTNTSNSDVESVLKTDLSVESSFVEAPLKSDTAPEAIIFSDQKVRNTIAYFEDVEDLSTKKLKAHSSEKYHSSYAINKCCLQGEFCLGHNLCKPLPETVNISDPWWWIAPSHRQNLSLDTLTDSQVSYGWKPCPMKMLIFQYFDYNNITLHRRQDEIRMEYVVDNMEGETTHEFPHDSFCLDVDQNGRHLAILCPCKELVCLRKCCKFGKEFDPVEKGCVEGAVSNDDWLPDFSNDWEIDQKYVSLQGMQGCGKNEKPYPVHNMLSNLELVFMVNGSIKSNVTGAIYPRDSFCGDRTPSGNDTLVICQPSSTSQELAISFAMGVLLAIGSLALMLTVGISCALPETRKRLNGRMALMHNSMLLVAYVSTGSFHLCASWYSMSIAASKVISFVIQFSFLSAFFWLNVMCIDIAMVFRGWRLVQGTAMQQEKKKFFHYSVYAWGSVCLISVATAIAEFVPGARPRPAFGEQRYFFNNDVAMLLFFYGPMATLLVANVILFIFTAVKIKSASQESRMVLNCTDSKTTKKNKLRLAVYVKLSTLMGVTWVFEVLSWAIGGDPRAWFFLDAANLLRAVFIFIIFCCNKKVYQQLKLRAQTLFSSRSSRVNANTPGTSGTTLLVIGSGKKSSEKAVDSARGLGKLEESKKPSSNKLKDFVRPSCHIVLDSEQRPCLKDTQL